MIDNLACARYPGSTAMLWIDWALVALRTDTSAVSKPRKRIMGSMDRILRFMEKLLPIAVHLYHYSIPAAALKDYLKKISASDRFVRILS